MPYDGQIGALEVGIVTSTFLFGITTTQTYLYYQLFPHDPKWTRQLVAVVWLFELGHSVSAVHALYAYTVLNFGNNDVPHMKVPLSIAVNLIISEIVFVFVQGYFLMRITKVSRTWFFTVGCTFLLFVRFVMVFLAFVEAVLMESLDQYTDQWHWTLVTLLAIGSFVDLVIPFGLVYFLLVQRSSAYKTTAAIVDKLILWTIETGLATGFLAVLILIFYLSLPGKFAWMSVYMCLPKMFSNAFLANLNSRVKLRAMQENNELEMSGQASNFRNTLHFSYRQGAATQVSVSTQRVRTIETLDGSAKPIEEVVPCTGDETPSFINDHKDVIIV